MSREELIAEGALYFEHIQQGFDNFKFRSLYMDGEEAFHYLKELWIKNGKKHAFVDFYYAVLEQDSRDMILRNLTEEEKQYVKELCGNTEDIYFPLDERLLRIITKLNDREILFSTVYFTKEPCTVWGNFKQQYVEFFPATEKPA